MSKYKPYPKYKDSGVEWLGQVPKGWKVGTVGKGYEVVLGKMLQPEQRDLRDQQVNYLKALHVNWERISCTDLPVMWATPDEINKYSVSIGDLLVCEGGEVGRAAFITDKLSSPCIIQNALHRVRAQENGFLPFLLRLLQSASSTEWFSILCNKATIAHLTREKFISLACPYPPLPEQQAIAAFLDQETAHIDAVISKQQHLIELLQEKRQALISHVVTKGLNPDAPMKDSCVEWLGMVPDGWKVSKLGFEAWMRARLGWKGLKAGEYVDDGYIFLATPNIKGDAIDFSEVNYITKERFDESPEIQLRVGDVLLAKDGSTLGTVNVIRYLPRPATVNSSIAVISHGKNIIPIFLFYLFQSAFLINTIQRIKGGMGVPHLFQADLNKFVLPLPPLPEQEAIVSFLDREMVKIDALIAKSQRAISLAQERRSAIISAAVTGKICVAPAQAQESLTKEQEYLLKAVLAAIIIERLYREQAFGRIKLQKLLHLCEYHARLPFKHSDYQRYHAGPLDPGMLYPVEGRIKKLGWFSVNETEKGRKVDYIPLGNSEGYKQQYAEGFAEKCAAIEQVLGLFRGKDSPFCQNVATVYGAWNDFLLKGHSPTDDEIIHDIKTNWDPAKQSIPESDWKFALAWMKKHSLIPTGWGKPIRQRQTS